MHNDEVPGSPSSDDSSVTTTTSPTSASAPGPGPSTSRSRAKKIPHTLGKGRACLKCRARKMRCDGKHPTCSSCLRANRECVYEEERSRTQKLLDKIDQLEGKLSELQSAANGSSPATSNKSCEFLGFGQEVAAGPPARAHADSGITFPGVFALPQDAGSDAFYLGGDSAQKIDFSGDWWWADHPPPAIRKFLLEVCLSQRARPALHMHVGRFFDSLSSASPPLPSLLNAMYLLGCNLSNVPLLASLEQLYLERARKCMAGELPRAHLNYVQWIQASCLVTYYLTRSGRFLEARHELSGASNLVVSCNLHKITSSKWHATAQPLGPPGSASMSPKSNLQMPSPKEAAFVGPPYLPPPNDAIELGERIGAFWMTYLLDHVTSLVCGLPPNRFFEAETETVWPRPFDEHETGLRSNPDASVSSLFGPHPLPPFDPPCSLYALRIKSIALLAREYHNALTIFLNGLPPLTHDPTSQEVDFDPPLPINIGIFLVQTMALVGFVHLYSALNIDHNTSPASGPLWTLYQNRLAICKRAVTLVKQVHDIGLPFKTLPTTCGFAWCAIARALAQHIRRLVPLSQVGGSPLAELEATREEYELLVEAILGMSSYQLERLSEFLEGREEGDLFPPTAVGSSSSSTPLTFDHHTP
ncbi:hypothetical protein M407DRAFT_4490 [Tulasnella calospora MUT 4182]|uniref:Zn(2)-C6 fungal-type domain-containing protein n=1 Tax=Tulasnella calospora MUT 4182 TaxID=1051891 RepID=A0A0C3MFM9_9AGAM|nr:hypothetical protein M407DRAFT_4490 [Tulasnella calospora MUT 4182]